jgi:hypothetical protein
MKKNRIIRNREEFRKLLAEQIALGQELRDTLHAGPMTFTNQNRPRFKDICMREKIWHDFNVELLNTSFNTKSILFQYNCGFSENLVWDFPEFIDTRLRSYISSLKSLLNRMDLIA